MAGLARPRDPALLVGPETSDDAGVYAIDERRALVQTVDLITPIVDDPFAFGEIAAANALSDVYAMGGRPLTALNILCLPVPAVPIEVAREVLRGGAAKVGEAGATVVGGHTVEDAELKFGLCVTGLVDRAEVTPNAGARPGEVLVLTKPIGTGIVSTALKKGKVREQDEPMRAAVAAMRALNRAAADAARRAGARGVTDVTGFGLGGHALELAIASRVSIEIHIPDVPLLPGAVRLAEGGCLTGGGKKNAAYYGVQVEVPASWEPILYDPQTSGGLLIAVAEGRATDILAAVPAARVIGRVLPPAEPRLRAIV